MKTGDTATWVHTKNTVLNGISQSERVYNVWCLLFTKSIEWVLWLEVEGTWGTYGGKMFGLDDGGGGDPGSHLSNLMELHCNIINKNSWCICNRWFTFGRDRVAPKWVNKLVLWCWQVITLGVGPSTVKFTARKPNERSNQRHEKFTWRLQVDHKGNQWMANTCLRKQEPDCLVCTCAPGQFTLPYSNITGWTRSKIKVLISLCRQQDVQPQAHELMLAHQRCHLLDLKDVKLFLKTRIKWAGAMMWSLLVSFNH